MAERYEVRGEYLRPEEIRAARERADLAFLPLGALEWHGVHGPVGVDALKSHGVCCQAAKKLGGGVVFPPLVWGVPRDSFFVAKASSFGDTSIPMAEELGTTAERVRGFSAHGGMDPQEQWLTYQRLLRMSLEQIAGFGFRSIYICVGHNPLIHWVRPVAIAFMRASQMAEQTVTIDFGSEYDAAGLKELGDHAGRWETSLMMALAPTAVNLEAIKRKPKFEGVGTTPDAASASTHQGETWLESCAVGIAEEARWLVENYPQLPPQRGR